MSLEDKIDEQAQKRVLIQPQQHIEPFDIGVYPMSNRNYDTLTPVQSVILLGAAAMTDDDQTVVAPIGGNIHVSTMSNMGDIGDLMASPKATMAFSPLPYNQIPIMVDLKPDELHDQTKEYDFGRLPSYTDYCDSVQGQEKPEEQVLAFPAWSFLSKMLYNDHHPGPAPLEDFIYNNLAFVRRAWCEEDTRYLQLLPYIIFYKRVGDEIHIFVYQRGKGVGEGRLAMGCSIGVGGHVNPIDFLSLQTKLAKMSEPLGNSQALVNVESQLKAEMTGRLFVESFWSGILNNVFREGDEEVEIINRESEIGSVVDLDDYIHSEAAKLAQSPEVWLHRRTTFFLDYAANPVEKVHLGMFIAIEVPAHFEISTKEESLHDVGFMDLDLLRFANETAPWETSVIPTPLECWTQSIIESLYDTRQFVKDNKEIHEARSEFIRSMFASAGTHSTDPELVAKIPAKDRWKIGTLSSSFDDQYRFYAMNAFVRA